MQFYLLNMHLSAWADCTTDSHVTTLLPPCLTGGLSCTFPSPYFSHWYKFMFISLVQYDRRTVQMLLEAFWQSVICPSHSWVCSPLHVHSRRCLTITLLPPWESILCVWLDVVKLSFSTSLCTLAVFCGLLGLLMLLKWPVFFLAKAAGGLLIWTLKTSLW